MKHLSRHGQVRFLVVINGRTDRVMPMNRKQTVRPSKHLGPPRRGYAWLVDIASAWLRLRLVPVARCQKPHPGANRARQTKSFALGVVRYAPDFVRIHHVTLLRSCVDQIKIWCERYGWVLNHEKSKLRDAREDFLFLGFQIIQVRQINSRRYKTKIQPCK